MRKYIHQISLVITAFLTVLMFDIVSGEKPYYRIVVEMGYDDVVAEPFEIVEVVIPREFDKVYQRYNELLKVGGYDLDGYKGRRCLRYTYLIPSINSRANILVCDGQIIGGDISGITLDGIMIPIQRQAESVHLQQIYL